MHITAELAAVLNDPSRAAEAPHALAAGLRSGEIVWQTGVRLGSAACGGPRGKQCDSAAYALREAVFSRPIWRPAVPAQRFRFVELFAGIGGFRLVRTNLQSHVVPCQVCVIARCELHVHATDTIYSLLWCADPGLGGTRRTMCLRVRARCSCVHHLPCQLRRCSVWKHNADRHSNHPCPRFAYSRVPVPVFLEGWGSQSRDRAARVG